MRRLAVFAWFLVAPLVAIAPQAANALKPPAAVTVSPAPGSSYASARTTISIRGVAAGAIGTMRVDGARSGLHAGTWIAHSDGNGATFSPVRPFLAGERVTVSTGLAVRGANGGTFSFTVARPSAVAAAAANENNELSITPNAQPPGTAQSFVTRPDLHPPLFDITKTGPTAPGVIAVTPRATLLQGGPLLIDDNGHVVWDDPIPTGLVTDLKVVHYSGHDDLAWWQGTVVDQGHGAGTYQLVDNHYTPSQRSPPEMGSPLTCTTWS